MRGTLLKSGLLLLGALLILGGAYERYQESRPCATPISYRIGTVDPRFGVSRAKLLEDTQDAARVWNEAAGKTVLRYREDGIVEVNLIYDARQQTVELGESISDAQARSAAARAKIDADKASYEAAQEAYDQEVQYWNSRGGAPRDEYAKLESARHALEAQFASLQEEIAAYNAGTRATNAKVNAYNATADTEFEQGEYVSDKQGRRINVYEFTDATKLGRTLEHEFGHALGLEHVSGADSIMYYENTGLTTKLSSQDISALSALCGL